MEAQLRVDLSVLSENWCPRVFFASSTEICTILCFVSSCAVVYSCCELVVVDRVGLFQ